MATQDYPGKDLSLSQLVFALNEELKRTAYSPSFTFGDVSQLGQDISAALANVREWRNSFVPVNRIPLDILSLIPTHLSSQNDLFHATFVCRQWRKTFVQQSALWSWLILKKGKIYTKTLLERVKSCPLVIVTGPEDPTSAIALLPPRTRQIRGICFTSSYWEDIQRFSEVNSGPLPLLHKLTINVIDEFRRHGHDRMTPPSLPLFSGAVNVKVFTLNSERFPFLGHFVFPNLTTLELSATPGFTSEPEYRGLELLDFLEASPRLQTVSMKVIAGTMELDDIPRERVVVLPKVNAFSLTVDDTGAGCELLTHISCPSVKRTSFVHEDFNSNELRAIFPPPHSWNTISRQYTRSPINEAALEMKIGPNPIFSCDLIFSCSLAFRSPDTTVLGLGFSLLNNEFGDKDVIPPERLSLSTFSLASRVIRNHPLLPNVKCLLIRYKSSTDNLNHLRYLANAFGRLIKSMGPLDVLSLHDCDPRFSLTPFLGLEEFNNMEVLVVYPPIKELKIFHPSILQHQEECITAIIEFAKSQHARGIPFERLELCMEKLPTGMAERLKPWVGVVDCYESPCPDVYEE